MRLIDAREVREIVGDLAFIGGTVGDYYVVVNVHDADAAQKFPEVLHGVPIVARDVRGNPRYRI